MIIVRDRKKTQDVKVEKNKMAELLVQYKANIYATNNMKETCMSFA